MSSNPVQIVESLDADQLAARLRELERERRAVIVLLRAARAKDRGRQRPAPAGSEAATT